MKLFMYRNKYMYIILNYNRAAVFEKKRMIYKNYQLGHLFHSLAARMGQDKKYCKILHDSSRISPLIVL